MDKLPNRPVFDQLRPNIYGPRLASSPALAAWVLFDRQSEIGLPLAMVSVLLLVAVLLHWAFSGVWKRHLMPDQRHPTKISFRDWRIGDFAVWGSKLHSTHAAADMLLPLAAVALGLTAIGIVFVICANGVALGCNQPGPRGVSPRFSNPDVPVRCSQRVAAYRKAGVIEKRHVGRFLAQDVESP